MKTTTPIIERNSYVYEIIEEYSCNSRRELLEREDYFIKLYDNCLNTRGAIRDEKRAKETKVKSDKNYREKNKDKLKIKRKEKYVPHPKIKLTEEQLKENHRLSVLKIKEQQFTRIECPCGGSYLHKHKAVHFRTKKHIQSKK